MHYLKLPLVIIPPLVAGVLSASLISTIFLYFITADKPDHLPALSGMISVYNKSLFFFIY